MLLALQQKKKLLPPRRTRGARARIRVSRDGVTIYGNPQAFRSIGNWMNWLAESNPREHFEFHLVWHMLSKFARQPNISVNVDPSVRRAVGRRTGPYLRHFEITFMAASPSELSAQKRPKTEKAPVPAARQRRETT